MKNEAKNNDCTYEDDGRAYLCSGECEHCKYKKNKISIKDIKKGEIIWG